MLHKLGRASSVHFDLAAIALFYANSPVAPELVWTIRKIGVELFHFGSDWPVDTARRRSFASDQGLIFSHAHLQGANRL